MIIKFYARTGRKNHRTIKGAEDSQGLKFFLPRIRFQRSKNNKIINVYIRRDGGKGIITRDVVSRQGGAEWSEEERKKVVSETTYDERATREIADLIC